MIICIYKCGWSIIDLRLYTENIGMPNGANPKNSCACVRDDLWGSIPMLDIFERRASALDVVEITSRVCVDDENDDLVLALVLALSKL